MSSQVLAEIQWKSGFSEERVLVGGEGWRRIFKGNVI